MASVAIVVATHLEAALARLGDLDSARAELAIAWAAAPHERTSKLVELVDAKLDAVLPYQLANLGSVAAAKAPAVLSAIAPDPRVAHELLDLLAKPPWRSNPTLPFWRMCCERIVATRDPRVLARLEEVALGYPKTIPTSVGHKVAGYLNKAAGELRAAIAKLPDLGERVDDACTALEAKLGAKPPAKRTLGAEISAELLAAVYAAPADDAPRMVLADHLMQRGDPRGEFINLQLARASGRADDSTRARELEPLAQSNGQWTGRVGMALEPERFAFHRGFVGYAQLPRTKGTLAQFAAEPAWSTIELLDVSWTSIVGSDRDALAQILASSGGVRGVLGVPSKFLATLDRNLLARLERLGGLEIATDAERQLVLEWIATAARPHTLGISVRAPKYEAGAASSEATRRPHLAPILASPQLARLERLILHTHEPQAWLGMLEDTALPVVVLAMSSVRVELVRDGNHFTRALLHQSHGHRAEYPEAITRHFANLLGERELVVDARTPFYPGLFARPTRTKQWPLLEGVVDDLAWLGR